MKTIILALAVFGFGCEGLRPIEVVEQPVAGCEVTEWRARELCRPGCMACDTDGTVSDACEAPVLSIDGVLAGQCVADCSLCP